MATCSRDAGQLLDGVRLQSSGPPTPLLNAALPPQILLPNTSRTLLSARIAAATPLSSGTNQSYVNCSGTCRAGRREHATRGNDDAAEENVVTEAAAGAGERAASPSNAAGDGLSPPRTTFQRSHACSAHVPNERVPNMFGQSVVRTCLRASCMLPNMSYIRPQHVPNMFRPKELRIGCDQTLFLVE